MLKFHAVIEHWLDEPLDVVFVKNRWSLGAHQPDCTYASSPLYLSRREVFVSEDPRKCSFCHVDTDNIYRTSLVPSDPTIVQRLVKTFFAYQKDTVHPLLEHIDVFRTALELIDTGRGALLEVSRATLELTLQQMLTHQHAWLNSDQPLRALVSYAVVLENPITKRWATPGLALKSEYPRAIENLNYDRIAAGSLAKISIKLHDEIDEVNRRMRLLTRNKLKKLGPWTLFLGPGTSLVTSPGFVPALKRFRVEHQLESYLFPAFVAIVAQRAVGHGTRKIVVDDPELVPGLLEQLPSLKSDQQLLSALRPER